MIENVRNEHEETEFNAAVATLERLNEIKKALDHQKQTQNQEEYFRLLQAYYIELDCVMKDDDKTIHETRFNDITNLHNKRIFALTRNLPVVPNNSYEYIKWERELRRLDQSLGMNIPKKGDPRFAMAKR